MEFTLPTIIVLTTPVIFGGLSWYFIKMREDFREDQKTEISRIQMHNQKIQQEELKIKNQIEESKMRGQTILKLSEKVAQELILELQYALNMPQDKFTTIIPPGEEFETRLSSMSGVLKSQYVKKIIDIVTTIDNLEKTKAAEIEKFEEEQMQKSMESLTRMKAEQMAALQISMNKYKNEELGLFNQKVEQAVKEAVLEVLGRELSPSDHEELIMKALEKARARNAI